MVHDPMSETDRLHHYLAAWELTDPQELAQTRTGRIYTVTYGAQTLILKLLATSETEEQSAALALRHFDGHGAVRLIRSGEGALLMEFAAGHELVTVVERGEDENATRIIAHVIDQLHGVPQDAPQSGLMPLDRWFGTLFSKAEVDQEAGIESIFVRGAELGRRLLADQRDVRVLHGDIHHYNIRQSPRGWLAFDPKGLVGERTYECASMLCNPVMPDLVHNETRLLASVAILADMLTLDPWRVLAFTYVYACQNASWRLQFGVSDIVQWPLKVAAIVEPHLEPPGTRT